MAATYLDALPGHGRFGYSAITARPGYRWPGGAGLAVYVALNHEHFAFGEGLGAALGPTFSSCSPTYALILATVLPSTSN